MKCFVFKILFFILSDLPGGPHKGNCNKIEAEAAPANNNVSSLKQLCAKGNIFLFDPNTLWAYISIIENGFLVAFSFLS